MKKAYLFIGLFALWCLVSALWYMFWVKGLSPDPENINPHESALAIAEILLMALISLLLGFAIAWHLRADSIAIKQEQLDHIRIETKSIETDIQTAREQLRKAEHTLARARETFREDFFAATREKERLQAELENNKREHSIKSSFQSMNLKLTWMRFDFRRKRSNILNPILWPSVF
jgi:hypothetical protein